MKREIRNLVQRVERRDLSNTQRVLIKLLNAEGAPVSRSSLRIPNVASRLRDLRKQEFGGFRVVCRRTGLRSTIYTLDPSTVTLTRLNKAFRTVL